MSRLKPRNIRPASSTSPSGEIKVTFTDEDVHVPLTSIVARGIEARKIRQQHREDRQRDPQPQPQPQPRTPGQPYRRHRRRPEEGQYLTPDEEIDRLLSSDSDSEAPVFIRRNAKIAAPHNTRVRPRRANPNPNVAPPRAPVGGFRQRESSSKIEAAPAQWDKVRCPRFHSLVYLPSRNSDGWACDFGVGALGHGKIDLYVKARFGLKPTEPWSCESGCTGHYQMQGVPMYTCRICNFDMCHKCYERAANALNKLKLIAAKVDDHKAVNVQHTKLYIVGEANAGKTSLVRSLLSQPFVRKRSPTTCLNVTHASAYVGDSTWTTHGALREDYGLQAVIAETNHSTPTPSAIVDALARKRRKYAVEASEVDRMLRIKDLDITAPSVSKSGHPNAVGTRKKGGMNVKGLGMVMGMSIWDFGGLEVFQHLHTRLLSAEGMYVVVFNMANCMKSKKSTTARIDACIKELLSRGAKSVLVVGTNFDLLERKQKNIKEIDAQLSTVFAESNTNKNKNIVRNTHRRTKLWFFPVENVEGAGISAVRQAILSLRQRSTTKLNLQWLRLLDSLAKDSLPFITTADLRKRATTSTSSLKFLRKEKEVETMLESLSASGFLLRLKGSVAQSQLVVLNPNWVAENLSKLIGKTPVSTAIAENAGVGEDLISLRKRAVASFDLLQLVWGKRTEITDFFIDLARKSLLLHDLPSPLPISTTTDSQRRRSSQKKLKVKLQTDYLVPKQLRIRRKGNLRQSNPTSLAQISFLNGPLPLGVFHRIVCLASAYGLGKTSKEPAKPPLVGIDFAVIASSQSGGRVWLELSKKRTCLLVASSHDVCAAKDLKVVRNMVKSVNQDVLECGQRWRTRYLDPESNRFVGEKQAKEKALKPWFAEGKRNSMSGRGSSLAKLDLDAFFESIQR